MCPRNVPLRSVNLDDLQSRLVARQIADYKSAVEASFRCSSEGRMPGSGRPIRLATITVQPADDEHSYLRTIWTTAGVGDVDDCNDNPDQHDKDYLGGTDRSGG